MSYGLNVEMHKQTEIAKRLSAICAQLVPFLTQEHQQQVAAAIERAKQVTMPDLNAIIGQQMHAQQFPHGPGVVGGLGMPGLGGMGGVPHGLLPQQLAGLAAAAAAAGGPGGAAGLAGLANLAGMMPGGLPGGLPGMGMGGPGQLPPPGVGGGPNGGPQGSSLLALGSLAGALVNHQFNQFNQLKDDKEVCFLF
jgi:groucho